MSNSVDPDQKTAECGIWSGSTQFALSAGIFIKHGNNENLPDTPYIGYESVQKVEVGESTRRKGLKKNTWMSSSAVLIDT